uniref:Uncharacterized protein n=1 Tax=Anguilla anguilla TaxID=7936 RepID=A0A0E9PBF5_ANGAN
MASRRDLIDFERGVVAGPHLVRASVTKAAETADVSRNSDVVIEVEGKTLAWTSCG